MTDQQSPFEQATAAVRRAMTATHLGEQSLLLEEALRLNRLAMAGERAKLAQLAAGPRASLQADGRQAR